MNSADLEIMYNSAQGSDAPIDMSFSQFSNLSDEDRSKVITDSYYNKNLSNQIITGDEFSSDLIDSASQSDLLNDTDLNDQASDIVSHMSNTYNKDMLGDANAQTIDSYGSGNYTVESGDSLSDIAMNLKPENVSMEDYMQQLKILNGQRHDNIQIGQELILPGSFEAKEKEYNDKLQYNNLSEGLEMSRSSYTSKTGDSPEGYNLAKAHIQSLAFQADNEYFGEGGRTIIDRGTKRRVNHAIASGVNQLMVDLEDPLKSAGALDTLYDIRTRMTNKISSHNPGSQYRNMMLESLAHLSTMIKYSEGTHKEHLQYSEEHNKRYNTLY